LKNHLFKKIKANYRIIGDVYYVVYEWPTRLPPILNRADPSAMTLGRNYAFQEHSKHHGKEN